MSDQKKIEQLIRAKKQQMEDWSCTVTPEMEQEKENMIKSFKHQAHSQKQTYSLINIRTGIWESIHISPDENGNPNESKYNKLQHYDHLLEFTHPDDKLFNLKLEIAMLSYLQHLSSKEISNFNFHYQRRLKTDSDEYQCFINNITVAISDASQHPWLVQVITKPCKLNPAEDPERNRIFSIQPWREKKNFKKFWTEEMIYLTDAEKQILHLIDKGNSKSRISELLICSEYTIKAHCSNILKKLFVNSMHTACTFSAQLGLL